MREQLQERASKLAVAEAELEEDRKSLDKRESHAANMEKQLERQRDSLKKLKEWAAQSNAELEESEASPHKRRLKCDTNISPRRLMTHLLHQMVHHRTTLRSNGQ